MKNWLLDHFLPMWAKETVLQENKQLHLENDGLRQKIREQEQYILGLQLGIRNLKRITIYNEGGQK